MCVFNQLLALALLLAASQTSMGQHVGKVNGCTRCPAEQYFDIVSGRCEQCTKCIPPLVEKLPCANEIPNYCDVFGQLDRLCCEEYEYEVYGLCVVNCLKCEGTGRCKFGLAECDCPPDRTGAICQHTILSSNTVEVDPTLHVTATSAQLVAMTTSCHPPSPTSTFTNKGSDSE